MRPPRHQAGEGRRPLAQNFRGGGGDGGAAAVAGGFQGPAASKGRDHTLEALIPAPPGPPRAPLRFLVFVSPLPPAPPKVARPPS